MNPQEWAEEFHSILHNIINAEFRYTGEDVKARFVNLVNALEEQPESSTEPATDSGRSVAGSTVPLSLTSVSAPNQSMDVVNEPATNG